MKKRIFLTILLCASMSFAASAEEQYDVDYDRTAGTVDVSGDAILSMDGDLMTYMLLKPGTDIASLESGSVTFAEVGVDAGEAIVSNGEIVFDTIKLSPNLTPGKYILRISDREQVFEKSIAVATPAQAINLMRDATTSIQVTDLLLGYNDVYNLATGESSLYAGLGNAGAEFVGKYLADNNPATASDIEKCFKQACALYKVYLGPWTGVKEVIADNAAILGINLGDLSLAYDANDVYKALTGNLYSDTLTFGGAYSAAILNSKAPAGGGSSGGSSGGGSPHLGTTIPSGAVTKPEIKPVETSVFGDLQSAAWAKDSVEALYKAGIVNGNPDGSFMPNNNVTRAEAVKMIVLTFGITSDGKASAFEDVLTDDWAYSYVSGAVEAGIVNGYSDTVFGKNDYITRQDMAVLIYRAAKASGAELDKITSVSFVDAAEIASYAKDAVESMSAAGIINGIDGSFVPLGNATRAQAAKMLAGFLK